ncbi:hypothetical protein [Novosphingobium sp. MBES04]|uniref:hypothetical protein n=1 Tax=Novosphingobium sp. MBES04 TaxID=1206458 RepID=UPI001185B9DF|nr:hypothetical protein [Novosphingobium sp. MBES04]
MLEIIGWMGCLYFVVKGIEISSSSSFRNEDGSPKRGITAAFMLCWAGAVVFGFLLADQATTVREVQSSSNLSNSIMEQCIQLAETPEAMAQCMK